MKNDVEDEGSEQNDANREQVVDVVGEPGLPEGLGIGEECGENVVGGKW